MCEHWECPYKFCHYHEFYDGSDNEELSWLVPENIEDVRCCMSYMDV
jgi:hypothetical protein